MGYLDASRQSKYQTDWVRKRREAWLSENGPCKRCGSTECLRVVNRDADVTRKNVFGWSDELRIPALKRCMVLCRPCMVKHHSEIMRKKLKGKRGVANTLTPEIVWAIRGRLLGRESLREIAEYYQIEHTTVTDIKKGRIWAWLTGGRRKVYGIERS